MKTEITLPVSELKTALLGLNKVISRSSHLPVLQSLRVVKEPNGAVLLQGTDLESFVSYHTEQLQTEGPVAEFLVPLEPLAKALKSSSAKDEIHFLYEGKDEVCLRTFVSGSPIDQVLEVPHMNDWPIVPEMLSAKSIALDDEFKCALKQAYECSSEDSSRYILNGVCLDVSDKKAHYLVSTNGRILYCANSFSFGLSQPLVIPNRRFLSWSGFLQDENWRLSVKPAEEKEKDAGGWIKIQSNHWTFIAREVVGTYPNWKQVIPENRSFKTRITLHPEAIKALLEIAPKIPGDCEPNHPIGLVVAEEKLFLEGKHKGDNQVTRIAIPEAYIVGSSVSVQLNRENLVKTLRFGLNVVEIVDGETPLLFKAGGKRVILAPLNSGPQPPESAPVSASTPTTPISDASQQPQEPSTTPSPEETIITPNPNERINMPTTTRTSTPNTTPDLENETPESPMKAAMQHVEEIRDTLKSVLSEFGELLTHLKAAEKEKKSTDKEIEAVRSTLKQIQNVRI